MDTTTVDITTMGGMDIAMMDIGAPIMGEKMVITLEATMATTATMIATL